MAMTVAISPGILILLLSLHNIWAQQNLGNAGHQNLAGAPQQLTKTTCGLNQMAQSSGLDFNGFPQQNMQQMTLQQLLNIQQPSTQQTGNIQQMNLQPANSQQSVNPTTNSQLLQQQNQNLGSNIVSALQNIRQVPQSTGTNIARSNPSQTNCCALKQNMEQISNLPQSQNQAYSTYTVPILNNPQAVNQPPTASSSFLEYPLYTGQAFPSTNFLSQQNKQIFPTVQDSLTNVHNQDYPIQSQPTSRQQTTAMQYPVVMGPSAQMNTGKSKPIVLTMQTPQMQTGQSQSSLSTNQPMMYTVESQPTSVIQNQMSSNLQGPNNAGMDNQPLMSYVMSQMQNPQTNAYPLAAMLPAMLNTKSEKSSSMKTLLPFILNMLTERKNGCVCPHCGCDNNNQNTHEAVINTGYSNQKNYSPQGITEDILSKMPGIAKTDIKPSSKQPTSKVIENKREEAENKISSALTSVEDDDEETSEEDYDEE